MTSARANTAEVFAKTSGAALGLRRAGWAHLACVERDPAAIATLRAAGFLAIDSDARDVDFAAFRLRAPMLWASSSTADQRRGATDERDGSPVTLAAIDACRPTWLLAEIMLD